MGVDDTSVYVLCTLYFSTVDFKVFSLSTGEVRGMAIGPLMGELI